MSAILPIARLKKATRPWQHIGTQRGHRSKSREEKVPAVISVAWLLKIEV